MTRLKNGPACYVCSFPIMDARERVYVALRARHAACGEPAGAQLEVLGDRLAKPAVLHRELEDRLARHRDQLRLKVPGRTTRGERRVQDAMRRARAAAANADARVRA